MKTPEQIAKETLTRSTRNPMDTLGHIIHAIEADRAQRAEILATDDAVLQVIEEQGFDWDNYQPNRDQIEAMLARVGFLVADAMNADRAQRREIYIVQNDLGEVVDVFRDPDEAAAAYQGNYSVIEEPVWEPGEWYTSFDEAREQGER